MKTLIRVTLSHCLKRSSIIRLRCRLGHSQASSEISENAEVQEKIIYSSKHPRLSFVQTKRIESAIKKQNYYSESPTSISLKYLSDETELKVKTDVYEEPPKNSSITLPYSTSVLRFKNYVSSKGNEKILEDSNDSLDSTNESKAASELYDLIVDENAKSSKNWMNDYEKYTGEETNTMENEGWKADYGTADPTVPVSNTPCGGCGAVLHCQDPSVPGFLPHEIFAECDEKDLRALKCQRCHFLDNYNTALSVTVDPHFYPQLLSEIKDVKALVIVLADMTDFPSSIWPGILDIIGRKRPIFLVGNKIDLLWGDSRGWLDRVKYYLRSGLPNWANVKHVGLISAKSGFGVEELITKLHNIWQYKGDVYLVGCTNVGKSTLFNSLLQSDYCKVKAVDLVQRATTAPWPGTTLNLLKFPILRPEGWRLFLRTKRLIAEEKQTRAEEKLRREQRRAQKLKPTQSQLIGHIGRTFKERLGREENDESDTFSVPNRKQLQASNPTGSGLDPDDPDLKNSKWLFDTPGVLHQEQILDLLTTEEIVLTLPKRIIEPRTFLVRPGWTTFIAGIARLDYIKGDESVKITVFASASLPVTICETVDAETTYNSLLKTDYLVIPQPNDARLEKWPGLQQGSEITLCGLDREESCADILLSSAGWIAITPSSKNICKFLPWTPYHRGIHFRSPPLLPFAVSLRGKKINKSPAYLRSRSYH